VPPLPVYLTNTPLMIRHLRTLCEYYNVSADYVLSLKRK
jgi:hypothetical protein